MKIITAAFLILLSVLSCKDDKEETTGTVCGVEDPLTDLEWLSRHVPECDNNLICQTSILQGIYQNETVFFFGYDGPLCDPAIHIKLYNCQGELIKEYFWEDIEAYENEVDSVKMLFSCWDK